MYKHLVQRVTLGKSGIIILLKFVSHSFQVQRHCVLNFGRSFLYWFCNTLVLGVAKQTHDGRSSIKPVEAATLPTDSEVKLRCRGPALILKSLLPQLDLHGVKFEWISRIFDPILRIFAKIKVQVVYRPTNIV